MEIDIREKEKKAYFWLTREESSDKAISELLKPLFKEYKEKKYIVAVFESGSESLRDVVKDLILYNRIRLRELEKVSEQ